MKPPTAAQLRAARALAGLSQIEVAERSGVSAATVKNIENDTKGPMHVSVKTLTSIMAVLQAAGIHFVDACEDRGPGVCGTP
jgi:transcriptional regulator with XRE-family HTH domain